MIEQPVTVTYASILLTEREAGRQGGLVHVSVGIESFDDLRTDLSRAFEAVLG